MARARNIKPGFFKNEDLAECSPWARLCFAGLWTLADREGRLEDRPKRIKGELFAFDSIEVEPLLAELVRFRFIARYAVDGLGVIQVLEFLKHQNPHHKEPESVLPSMESPGLLVDGRAPKPEALPPLHDTKTPDKPETLGSTNALPSTQNRAESPIRSPDPGFLNPDSGFRIPDVGAATAKPEASKPAEATGTRPAAGAAPTPRGHRLAADWVLPKAWGDWALAEMRGWTAETTRLEAAKFADHWHAKAGKDAAKTDWFATWRNWCRNARTAPAGNGAARYLTEDAMRAENARTTAEAKRLLFGTKTPETFDA